MEIVNFNNVSISFDNTPLLNNFNLQILSGEFVLLAGSNGSGKTSLVKALLGEINFEGSIFLNGKLLTKQTELFKNISYVSAITKNNFISGVVEDELMLPLIEQNLKKKQANKIIDFTLQYFNCYHLKKCNISTLSGGEKQLVALLSALLCGAKLVILDEALSNMDYNLKLSTFNKLKLYLKKRNASLLFITNETCFDGFDKTVNLTSCDEFKFKPIYSKTNNKQLLKVENFVPILKKQPINYGVSFSLSEKNVLALIGESGSGKSLVINALAGFEKFYGTKTLADGIKNTDIKILFQEAENYLLQSTVFEELGKVKNATNYLNLLKITGLDKKLNLTIDKLSSGEKRMLALIEILLTNPKILILDEIFANLSANSCAIVAKLLKTFTSSGGAIIIVEHNIERAKLYANQIVKIKKLDKKVYVEKSVSLGKYIYKNTPLHKTPALIKVLFTVAFIVLTFLAKEWWHFGALFSFYVFVTILSLSNPFKIFKSTIPLWVFALFIFLLNSLTIDFTSGLKMFYRLGLLNLFVPILTLTTSPFELLTALPIKLVPFNILKKFVLSLEFISVTSLLQVENGASVAKNAMRWQKNLGVHYKGAPLKTKAKNIGEIFVLLFRYLVFNSKNLATTLYLKGAYYRWYTK